ncbi:hypothetical protein ET445_05020 [Agromyces protaetiae]|uniref:PepSY domain-containing protein n=1 Tax=Agromyces protaetiae TaxID=2509455 RepID=A0A4P6FQJ2_9MICO|nr:PepSY domain-containing protein [Agromyces protaetiae]QAY72798.1 hypothetical protein ET445_05020 [Agromyces protaetiae]
MHADHRTSAVPAAALRAATVLVAAVALLTACTGTGEPSPTAAEPPAVTETEAPDASNEPAAGQSAEGPLDAHDAVAAAIAFEGGVVVELGPGREQGVDVWEVGLIRPDGSGVELHVARDDGRIVSQEPLRLDPEQTSAPALTAAEAIALALETEPGEVRELDLGTERGIVVWEVIVDSAAGGRFELYLDAATGTVVKHERAD